MPSFRRDSDSDRLDDAAVECISKWHYRPAIKDDQTIDAPMTVKVDWKLGERESSSDGDAEKKDQKAVK